MNKTNHLFVFSTAEETTFDLSASFEGLFSKDVVQSKLDTFFTWEVLTNENTLHLAKETGNKKNFFRRKFASKLPLRKGWELIVLRLMCKHTGQSCKISFSTEEAPVEIKKIESGSHIRFMDPISRLTYHNYTLTLCNRVYFNAFELSNGSWVSHAKQLKLISSPKELEKPAKNATLSSFDNNNGGFFTDKDLGDSHLSQLMKHSRKTIIGREAFLEKTGKMLMINWTICLKVSPYSWYCFPWFAKMETQVLRYVEIVREVAITTLTVYLLFQIIGLILRIFFFAALLRTGQ